MFTVLRARASAAAPRAVSRASMARIASPATPRLLPLSASRTFATTRATLFPEKKSTEPATKKASPAAKTKAKATTATKKAGVKAKPKPKKKVVAKKAAPKKVAPKKKPTVDGVKMISAYSALPQCKFLYWFRGKSCYPSLCASSLATTQWPGYPLQRAVRFRKIRPTFPRRLARTFVQGRAGLVCLVRYREGCMLHLLYLHRRAC